MRPYGFLARYKALMPEDHIRYDILTQEALRGVVRKVLSEVQKTGLPGEHHFFISFMTQAPGVRMSQRLLDQYEKEMTIVLQNQFWDLKVTETRLRGRPELRRPPRDAGHPVLRPQGLLRSLRALRHAVRRRAHRADDEQADRAADRRERSRRGAGPDDDAEPPGEKVVSLDSFRKKP